MGRRHRCLEILQVWKALIVVDSSTWVFFFNDTPSAHANRLESALVREEDIAVIPIIVTEVLQGFSCDHGFEQARSVLTSLPVLEPDLGCHVRAASLYRRIRSKGVTVRGAVDCVIAQTCIDSVSTLLSPDSDFRLIASHAPLKLWQPS